ncbi:MAG: YlmH/Sll1252 family protein [Lachnospiraceae bacterium]
MTSDELQLQKRFEDLKRQSESNNRYTYTGFLTLAEQELFFVTMPRLLPEAYSLYGGFPDAERKVLRFGSPEQLWYEEEFPVSCIEIRPVSAKFAEKLSHRDVLGALMNLGIERSLLGDIAVKEKVCYVMCLSKIAEYITEQLGRIRHTEVNCYLSDSVPKDAAPDMQELSLISGSLRADGIISKVFHLSRAESEGLFTKGYVFANGRQVKKASVLLKENDVVSVRGYGKFRFGKVSHETRKGNLGITVYLYV